LIPDLEAAQALLAAGATLLGAFNGPGLLAELQR
jgi:hypothetical protein